jgi:ABC-type multidrug transport system ATPase subunit
MSAIIQVHHLSKKFGDFTAVDNLSFTVPQGSIYGFLGQNGAGKSTTIRMLTTLIEPTGGDIEIFGKSLRTDSVAIRKNIGSVIERPDLYKYLTAYENVSLFAKLSGKRTTKKEIEDILHLVGLDLAIHKKMKTFSQGMKQRLGIATSLIHQPELIILDEPVNGLDPQGIADMRQLILKLKNDFNKTVLLSSHLLSEMEMIATDLLIIHKGKKVVEGKVSELLNPENVLLELITVQNADLVIEKIKNSPIQHEIKSFGGDKTVVQINKEETGIFNSMLMQSGIQIISVRPKQSLEDYFIEQIEEIEKQQSIHSSPSIQ